MFGPGTAVRTRGRSGSCSARAAADTESARDELAAADAAHTTRSTARGRASVLSIEVDAEMRRICSCRASDGASERVAENERERERKRE